MTTSSSIESDPFGMADLANEHADEDRADWLAAQAAKSAQRGCTTFATRDEWLRGRAAGIGGSEVAIVMGASSWGSPYSLWAKKTGLAETDFDDNEVLEFGRLVEPLIADKYATKTGRTLIDLGPHTIRRHPTLDFLFVTHDRLIAPVAEHDGLGVLSIKSVNPFLDEADWADAEAPLKYEIQLQAELAASGLKWGSFAFLRWGRPLQWFDRARNDSFIEAMELQCADFWRRVVEGDAPPVDGSEHTSAALKAMYPKDTWENVELGVEALDWGEELEKVDASLKQLNDRREELRNRLKAAIGTASMGTIGGRPAWRWQAYDKASYTVGPTTVRALTRVKSSKKAKG